MHIAEILNTYTHSSRSTSYHLSSLTMADSIPFFERRRTSQRYSPCCCILVLLLAFLFLTLPLSQAQLPFSIDHHNVTKLSLSNLNQHSFLSYLHSSINVSLKISDATNITFIVDDMNVKVLYDDSHVSLGKGKSLGKFCWKINSNKVPWSSQYNIN